MRFFTSYQFAERSETDVIDEQLKSSIQMIEDLYRKIAIEKSVLATSEVLNLVNVAWDLLYYVEKYPTLLKEKHLHDESLADVDRFSRDKKYGSNKRNRLSPILSRLKIDNGASVNLTWLKEDYESLLKMAKHPYFFEPIIYVAQNGKTVVERWRYKKRRFRPPNKEKTRLHGTRKLSEIPEEELSRKVYCPKITNLKRRVMKHLISKYGIVSFEACYEQLRRAGVKELVHGKDHKYDRKGKRSKSLKV
jgi:hypothetical protein